MITILTNLKDIIKTYDILHLNQEKDEQTLLLELAKIENDSHSRYFSHGTLELAQESFRKFYTKLIILFNMLYQKKEGQADTVILKFQKLVNTF